LGAILPTTYSHNAARGDLNAKTTAAAAWVLCAFSRQQITPSVTVTVTVNGLIVKLLAFNAHIYIHPDI